jgi:predicted transposase YdaD
MFQVHDIRETRVYQEAKEEGLKEGFEKGLKEGFEKGLKEGFEKGFAIVRLLAEKKSVADIAAILAIDVELVRKVLAQMESD